MNVLIDTSVWSLALRRKREDLSPRENAIVRELTELIREGRVCIVGLIRQELLSGIRFPDQFEKIRSLLREFPDEQIMTSDHESAALHSNACRGQGVSPSLVGLLICQVGASRGWPIFTTDPDFQQYAKIIPIQLYNVRA